MDENQLMKKESDNGQELEDEIELEDLDRDTEQEHAVPDVAGEQEESAKEGLSEKFLKMRGKADTLFEKGMTAGQNFYQDHKEQAYSVYDKFMDFKDDIHDRKKASGDGFIKTAASVLGDRIRDTETYKKFAASKVGKGIHRGMEGIKTGASKVKEKMANSKLGQWIAKKKEEKPDEPGFFAKTWGKIKSGAASLKEKAANSKLGQWIAKKKEEKSDEPGFFTKAWGKIKSGAGKLKERAVNSRLGQWIAKKKAESDAKGPGVFARGWEKIKTGAGALKDKAMNSRAAQWMKGKVNDVKSWVGEQKEWLDEKKGKLLDFKTQAMDDFDEHEFERRMNQKARNGDPDYEKRYGKLVEELKENPELKRLSSVLSKDEITKAIKELESGEQAEEEKGVFGKVQDIGEYVGKAGKKLGKDDMRQEITDRFGEKAGKYLPSSVSAAGSLIKAGGNIGEAVQARKRTKAVEAERKNLGDDNELQRMAGYAVEEGNRQTVEKSFEAAGNVITGAKSLAGVIPGGKNLASAAGFAVKTAKNVTLSKMDKKAVKGGLKQLLGGPEGYRKLKEKYRLQAPEMRRAIREAVGVNSEKDVLNTDKRDLSNKLSERMANKDEKAIQLAQAMGAHDAKSANRAMGGTDEAIRVRKYKHRQPQMV